MLKQALHSMARELGDLWVQPGPGEGGWGGLCLLGEPGVKVSDAGWQSPRSQEESEAAGGGPA